MSYGLELINNDDKVVLGSSSTRHFSFQRKITVSTTGADSYLVGNITELTKAQVNSIIETVDLLETDVNNKPNIYSEIKHSLSLIDVYFESGSWKARYISYYDTTFDVYVFNSIVQSSSEYGMETYDDSGDLLFSTNKLPLGCLAVVDLVRSNDQYTTGSGSYYNPLTWSLGQGSAGLGFDGTGMKLATDATSWFFGYTYDSTFVQTRLVSGSVRVVATELKTSSVSFKVDYNNGKSVPIWRSNVISVIDCSLYD